MRKTVKQNEDKIARDNSAVEEKVNQIRTQMNTYDEKYNQKLLTVSCKTKKQ